LTLQLKTGLFTGAMIPSGSKVSLPFQGALLQLQKIGVGFFALAPQSGKVTVAAAGPPPVLSDRIHYVSLGSMNPVPPFLSWETAATNIQDAIDAAVGNLVLVSNGVYETGSTLANGSLSTRVAVTKPVTVASVNGPDTTFIKGQWNSDDPLARVGSNSVRCVYLTNGASLIGFTIMQGSTEENGWGGGVWCEGADCVVSNCLITGNAASEGGGIQSGTASYCTFATNFQDFSGGARYSTLNHCLLAGNSTLNNGGGAGFSVLNDCTLVGNQANNGGGASDSTLNRCSIEANSSVQAGGGAYLSTLQNCYVIGNMGNTGGGVSTCTLNNSVIASNLASFFGGGEASSILNNCTLVGNAATEGGGAWDGTLNNCVVWYNDASGGQNFSTAWMTLSMNNCATSPSPPNGNGNITLEPLFVDAASGNFHLQALSPCVDHGLNSYMTNSVDLDGNPRIVNGTVDIGAFEFQPTPGPANLLPATRLR
jgi:hypothetical protein